MSPTHALLWKEWRQMRWRWAFCLTVCCLFVIVGLKTRIMPDQGIILLSFGICAFAIPLFIGIGLVAEEREENSLKLQLALPVQAMRVYVVKMAMGASAVAASTIASLIIALLMAGNREESAAEIFRIYAFVIPFGIIFMLWIVVFSMKRKTQWAAVLTGIAIGAIWVFLIIFEDIFGQSITRNHWNLSLIITPFGFLEAASDNGKWLAVSIVQGIISVILFGWGMRRFSSLTRSDK